jgi:DNA-binding CsgD family transcriptional regulator
MKSSLQHIYHASIDVLEIAEIFLQQYGLMHFSLIRFLSDYEYYALTTHPQMSVDYLKKKFYLLDKGQDPHLSLHNEAFLWIAQEDDPTHGTILSHAREYYNLSNGITIPFQHPDYLDLCVFATTPTFTQANSLYLNQFDIFKTFYQQFIEAADKIMKKANQHRIIFPEIYNKHHANTATASKIIIPDTDLFLSSRERDCLKWVARGKTSNEIGIILGISPRTVEEHISNCKTKFKCSKLTSLIYKAAKLGLI